MIFAFTTTWFHILQTNDYFAADEANICATNKVYFYYIRVS